MIHAISEPLALCVFEPRLTFRTADRFHLLDVRMWGTLLVAQLVEALRYKSEGRGFDSRRCHWNFSLT